MSHILVLTADPARAPLDQKIVARARALLAHASDPLWLAPALACEITFAEPDPRPALARVRQALSGVAVDANVVPAAKRRKRLLVADMESTIIENEMLDDLATTAGIGEAVADITHRAMNGELDFRDALRERVALLAGLPVEQMEEAAGRIRIMPGAATLVATMKANGAYTALVSGGFLFFTGLVRAWVGFDHHEGNDLEIAAGALTGEVREPVLNRDSKVEALRRIAAERGLSHLDAIAVGDGANDVPMLLAAGMGVAYRAKPVVAAAADLCVDHGDLTALLYLQGYRQSEFASHP